MEMVDHEYFTMIMSGVRVEVSWLQLDTEETRLLPDDIYNHVTPECPIGGSPATAFVSDRGIIRVNIYWQWSFSDDVTAGNI